MLNRANEAHRGILTAYETGVPYLRDNAYASEYRGARTALDTLLRWGCVENSQLTERGRELLTALNCRALERIATYWSAHTERDDQR